MRYAPFSSEEYNCLDHGLEGISEIIDLLQAESQITAIQKELDGLIRAVPSRSQAVQRIEVEISKISGSSKEIRESRREQITALIDAVRCQMQEEWNIRAIASGRIREICSTIHGLYSTFDAEKFTEDIKQLIAEDKGRTAEDRIKQLNSEKSNISSQIKKNWNGRRMEKFFRFIPDVWRDRKISAEFKSGDMAIHILRSLIDDWRVRCRYYAVEVTVGGVNIHTLEPALFETWMGLYRKLGLKPGSANTYMFRDAQYRGNKRTNTEGLPGFFGSAADEAIDDELSRI